MRLATRADLERIVAIYNATVPLRIATADIEPVSVDDRLGWFERHDPHSRPILVEESGGEIVAWLSFSDVVGRPGYRKTAELSLYIDERHRGRGLGTRLLGEAIALAPGLGIESIIGLVFSHNEASMHLFRRCGFAEWGRLPDVVEMDDNLYSVSILGRRVGPAARED